MEQAVMKKELTGRRKVINRKKGDGRKSEDKWLPTHIPPRIYGFSGFFCFGCAWAWLCPWRRLNGA